MADQSPQQGWVPVPDPTKLTTDAVSLAKADIEKLFDTKMSGFRELVTEKFAGRDTALAAALKAAQELVKQQNDSNTIAIDKAALAFTKQIDSLDEKINDLKERMALDRGSASGGRRETVSWIFSAIAVVGSVVAMVVAILKYTH